MTKEKGTTMDGRERESLIRLAWVATDLAARLDDLAGFAGEMQPGDIAWRMRRARKKARAIHDELIGLLARPSYRSRVPFKVTWEPPYQDED